MKKQRDSKHTCPLCGQRKLEEYDICDICTWEYTGLETKNPNESDGCNHVALNEAKIWFAKYGKKWYSIWWEKMEEHYGKDNTYDKWLKDETGWKPEPPKE